MTDLITRLREGSGPKTLALLRELAEHGVWQGWGYLHIKHSIWTARFAKWHGLIEWSQFRHEGPFFRITAKGLALITAKEPSP